MLNIAYPQNNNNRKKQQEESTRSEFLEKTHGDVLQDTYAQNRVRVASIQAQPDTKFTRTDQSGKNPDRVKKLNTKYQRVHKAIWVTRPISLLIDECAAHWGVSPSRAGERLIELGLQHNLMRANTKLITDIIHQTLQEECRRFFGRLTGILFRMYLLLSRVFYLQKNLLGRSGFQKHLTVSQLDKIIAWSGDQAREDVVRKTGARSEALDQAIEEWLFSDTISKPKEGEGDGEEPPQN